ncbi:MAG: insulinase family protein [Bdellovibrionales bacterium]|nr:insulinase family protein [Bdellovibrionales bacterium]
MQISLRIFFVFWLITFCVSREVLADPRTPQEAFDRLEQQVRSFRLNNGLRVFMYRRGIAPVFSGVVSVRVGGVDEQRGQTGISHMFEHMAFKGTKEIGTRDFAREKVLLDELEALKQKEANRKELTTQESGRQQEILGMLQGLWDQSAYSKMYEKRGAVGLNASTSSELTNFFVSLPRTQFEFWCWMESERLLEPIMRQFYKERDVVLEELLMRVDNNPNGRLYQDLFGTAFFSHPYRNPVIGYKDDVSRLTASMADNFRRKYYVPSNMAIGLVGDVDPERDIEIVRKYFERLPARPAPQRPSFIEEAQNGERQVIVRKDASPLLYIGYHKQQYPHPDGAALDVLLSVLADGRTSWLDKQLVQKQQVATSVGAFSGPGEMFPDLAVFYLEPKIGHSTLEVKKAYDHVIERFLQVGPSEKEVEKVKRRTTRSFLDQLDSNLSLARDFTSSALIFDDWRASLQYYDQLVKVNRNDVHRVARQYLTNDNRTVARLEKP